MAETSWLQPTYYDRFRCSGAACQDTCCSGWGITVDRETFDSYSACPDREFGARLQELITIQPQANPNQYGRINLADATCPVLTEGLCGVHQRLGEEYLSRTCATYPRVVNAASPYLERSLDLSCPEAARLALLNPEPDDLELATSDDLMSQRLVAIVGDRSPLPAAQNPDVPRIREFLLRTLQNRRFPVAKRLLLVAAICDKLQHLPPDSTTEPVADILSCFEFAIDSGLFDPYLYGSKATPASQLAIVLELVVARIGLDYTSPRFRNLYSDFMEGLRLQPSSTIVGLGNRYAEAHQRYYRPIMQQYDYVWEHFLVAYAYRTQFPFQRTMAEHYLLLCCYFAVARALAIGLAARYRAEFTVHHVVDAIQACSRTLEHCASYPDRALSLLTAKGIVGPSGAAVLTQDFYNLCQTEG